MILMDCNMPMMDGWTATREIRLLEQKRRLSTVHMRIPIVGLSASPLEKAKPLGLEMGMDDYLTKPVKAKEQMVNIAKWNCALQWLTVQDGGEEVQAGDRVLLRELLRQLAADTPELEPRDAQAKEAYAPMAAAVHRLVRSCGTQFCGVDLTSALDDGNGIEPGTAWSRFALEMIAARDALGTLVPRLHSADRARDDGALRETVLALRGTFARCLAEDACELCTLFESELGIKQTREMDTLIDALKWQAMQLIELGRLIGEHHTKLDFQHGIQTYGSCVAFQQQLQMFCFNATGYVSLFSSGWGGLGLLGSFTERFVWFADLGGGCRLSTRRRLAPLGSCVLLPLNMALRRHTGGAVRAAQIGSVFQAIKERDPRCALRVLTTLKDAAVRLRLRSAESSALKLMEVFELPTDISKSKQREKAFVSLVHEVQTIVEVVRSLVCEAEQVRAVRSEGAGVCPGGGGVGTGCGCRVKGYAGVGSETEGCCSPHAAARRRRTRRRGCRWCRRPSSPQCHRTCGGTSAPTPPPAPSASYGRRREVGRRRRRPKVRKSRRLRRSAAT